ncbi:unnamed protein product [Phytomonas sp. EM1]|nr:unnamed protein product [Phytomonas sp. EM1]|eukprot:CCW61393.1 unnamed protein product [Phytomonas sp. isolate EM1]
MRPLPWRRIPVGGVLAVSPATFPSSPLRFHRRYQTRIPNKGYRTQPEIPDRIKDTVSLYGNQGGVASDGETYVPLEQRSHLMQEVMSNSANMKNYYKLDRLRTALNMARNEKPEHASWQELYMFFRTTEMCLEVRKEEGDVFPKGQKLWVELESCEERRVPKLLEMPNGLLVLPVCSIEECLDQYFCRTNTFESCWFPVPRMGTRWESFCAMPFPVCVIGSLERICALATVALPPHQFGILINPGQYSSKFITYPEMVQLSKIKHTPMMERELTLMEEREGKKELLFDAHLMTIFNTQKMALKSVEPHEVEAKMRARPPIPPIAQLELHLLLFKYPEIERVYVRTVERPRWRTMMGVPEKLTEIDIIPVAGKKPAPDFLTHLKRWSYMSEFRMDVHIELTAEVPEPSNGSVPICVYTSEDGELLRSMYAYKGEAIARSIGFHEPLVDENGRKPYEGYNYTSM